MSLTERKPVSWKRPGEWQVAPCNNDSYDMLPNFLLQGLKLNTIAYIDVLDIMVKPWMDGKDIHDSAFLYGLCDPRKAGQ